MSLRGAQWERAEVRRGNRMLYRAAVLPCDDMAFYPMSHRFVLNNQGPAKFRPLVKIRGSSVAYLAANLSLKVFI